MGSLSNLYISQSYQSLIHLATNNTASATLIDLQDGLGNSIGVSVNTGGDLSLSGSLTASLAKGYVWVGNGNDRTILVATSSFFTSGSGPTDITSLNAFTASQLNINAGYNQYTSSTNIRLNNLESTSASVNISISNLNASSASQQLQINSLIAATGSYVTSAITASSLVTASVNLNTITFTKGDASTFNITVNTGSGGGGTTDISSLNAFTASQETKDLTLASVTSSLNSATASLFTSASLALVTASVNNDDITFTKGDGSQFTIQVATGSFAISASYAETASFALNGGVTQILAGPNITVSPLSGQGQVTISSTGTGSGGFNTTTGSYGSFYDTTTQINPVANAANSMSFNETAITNGVSISGSTNPFNTYIKTENAGVYNFQFLPKCFPPLFSVLGCKIECAKPIVKSATFVTRYLQGL